MPEYVIISNQGRRHLASLQIFPTREKAVDHRLELLKTYPRTYANADLLEVYELVNPADREGYTAVIWIADDEIVKYGGNPVDAERIASKVSDALIETGYWDILQGVIQEINYGRSENRSSN
jgi:hypothetical protein